MSDSRETTTSCRCRCGTSLPGVNYLGTPEKTNRELARLQPRTMAQAALRHGYPVTRDSVVTSRQMFLSAIQRQPGHCQAHTKAKIMTKKRRRSLRIFSAHITRNAMQIEVSAPLASRGIINFREYFRFPDPKQPSTSFRLRRSALSSCLWAAFTSGSLGGLPNRLPDSRMLFLVQKLRFFVLI
jgi:hypothetical protein